MRRSLPAAEVSDSVRWRSQQEHDVDLQLVLRRVESGRQPRMDNFAGHSPAGGLFPDDNNDGPVNQLLCGGLLVHFVLQHNSSEDDGKNMHGAGKVTPKNTPRKTIYATLTSSTDSCKYLHCYQAMRKTNMKCSQFPLYTPASAHGLTTFHVTVTETHFGTWNPIHGSPHTPPKDKEEC